MSGRGLSFCVLQGRLRIPGGTRVLRRVGRSVGARAALAGVCALLAGCAGVDFASLSSRAREQARLDAAQECAIGYDMARQIYALARVNQTVVRVSPRLGACGAWAAQYLRRAGFAVDETAKRRDTYVFTVTTYEDGERVIATTALPGLRLTRAYRRAAFGVLPASGFNVTTEGEPG
ncbi:hypothetical protein [Ruegeria sp.]|uniref:hypothetical protein n=1 Tax=Ruegeria sp. TaxID=1879320 RepID=UPI003B005F09